MISDFFYFFFHSYHIIATLFHHSCALNVVYTALQVQHLCVCTRVCAVQGKMISLQLRDPN